MNFEQPTHPYWKAATRKLCITPREPIRLAGFADRFNPTGEVLQDIHARTLVLQDEAGQLSVLLATDLLGFSRDMSETIARGVQDRFGLSRDHVVLNASHNHSGPVTGDLLHLYFELSDDEKLVIARYTQWLVQALVDLVGETLRDLQPVGLSFGLGAAGFGTNRRRATAGFRHFPGPVDHDVPVLAVRTVSGDMLAVVFGYACHTTASHGNQIHGDYAGFAQTELEALYPPANALFVAGCGGDINPLPRARPDAAQTYGGILASAVEEVLKAPMTAVTGPLRTSFTEVNLGFQTPPTRGELLMGIIGATGLYLRGLQHALSNLERDGQFSESCPFPIQVWQFGDALTWIFLSGEPVVDYALFFKTRCGFNTTWVSGYCNELLAYIPSLRVLREGGYEGGAGSLEYGLPAPFAEDVEEKIVAGVAQLHRAL